MCGHISFHSTGIKGWNHNDAETPTTPAREMQSRLWEFHAVSFSQKNFSSPSLFKFHSTFLGTVVSWVRHLVGMLHPFFLNSCYDLFPSLCQLLSSTPITLLKSTSTLDIFKKSTWSLDSGSKVAYKQGLCRII